MIILSNTTDQQLLPGQAITFNTVVLQTRNDRCSHRENSAGVRIRTNGIHEIQFSGNVDGATAAAPATLVVAYGGARLPETTMISAATGFNNVATSTAVRECGCCCQGEEVTVVNAGTATITIGANAKLFIKRIA